MMMVLDQTCFMLILPALSLILVCRQTLDSLVSPVSPVSYLPISPNLRRTYERLTMYVRAITRFTYDRLPGLSAENGPTIDIEIEINADTNV